MWYKSYGLEPTQGGAGTREEPGTLTQGVPVFPGSSRLGIQNSRVSGARPNHQADRGSDPNHLGICRFPLGHNKSFVAVVLSVRGHFWVLMIQAYYVFLFQAVPRIHRQILFFFWGSSRV